MRAHQAIERADVVVLVLDGSEPIAAQDTHIAGFAQDASRPIVVAINKWDLVEERDAQGERLGGNAARAPAVRQGGSLRPRQREERAARDQDPGSRRRVVRGRVKARADARTEHLASGGIDQGAPRSRERGERAAVLRHADRHPPAPVRRVLQRGPSAPFLAAPPSGKQPPRAFRLRCGAAAADLSGVVASGPRDDRAAASVPPPALERPPPVLGGPRAQPRRGRGLLLVALAPAVSPARGARAGAGPSRHRRDRRDPRRASRRSCPSRSRRHWGRSGGASGQRERSSRSPCPCCCGWPATRFRPWKSRSTSRSGRRRNGGSGSRV